jgi:hypothetical protein
MVLPKVLNGQISPEKPVRTKIFPTYGLKSWIFPSPFFMIDANAKLLLEWRFKLTTEQATCAMIIITFRSLWLVYTPCIFQFPSNYHNTYQSPFDLKPETCKQHSESIKLRGDMKWLCFFRRKSIGTACMWADPFDECSFEFEKMNGK